MAWEGNFEATFALEGTKHCVEWSVVLVGKYANLIILRVLLFKKNLHLWSYGDGRLWQRSKKNETNFILEVKLILMNE